MKRKISIGTSYCSNSTNPEAYISIQKNRQKVYEEKSNYSGSEQGGTVYLPNQVEFEIELFNPTSEKILAVLTLNGKRDNQGFILKPGQRYFLDRHLNENKKFLFDVYEVSSNNNDVQKAIANNGKIKVEFYKEKTYHHYSSGNVTINTYPVYPNITINPPNYPYNPFWYGTGGGPLYRSCCTNVSNDVVSAGSMTLSASTKAFNTSACTTTSLNAAGCTITPTSSTGTVTFDSLNVPGGRKLKNLKSDRTEETGRVDKGSYSGQTFRETEFIPESYSISSFSYTLLPVSKKPLNSTDINNQKKFCCNCGAKVNKSDKFCFDCGTRL